MKRGVRLTKEEVQNRIDQVHNHSIVMSNYLAASKKADFKCKNCGYEWSTQPRSVYYLKTGCPNCANNAPLTTDDLKQKIADLVGDEYVLMSECHGRHEKVKLYHTKCGETYEVEVGSFLLGKRHTCDLSERISNGLSMSLDDMLDRLYKAFGNEYVYKSGFTTVNDYAVFEHSECGKLFRAIPRQLYTGLRGCTYCSSSKGEKAIDLFLSTHKIKYKRQYILNDCRDKNPLPFDFAVFDDDTLNCLIEYQGIQHYQEIDYFGNDAFISTTTHDILKKKYCQKNNIQLFCIKAPDKLNATQLEINNYVDEYLTHYMLRPNQADQK